MRGKMHGTFDLTDGYKVKTARLLPVLTGRRSPSWRTRTNDARLIPVGKNTVSVIGGVLFNPLELVMQ